MATPLFFVLMKISFSSVNHLAEEIFENIDEHKSKFKPFDYVLFNFIFLR